ncbi:P-loop containing nucleoside triphosphate hydrolase protein [Armillaria novae-zelandiae]|uniref:P-loop containing nucleoside triphosphate hydrolase protein n=1 Tax=Armillaria novae-zelandiae TaxID=153914 RepID=A0AA39P028_9AGAR|nr:P-loop containing nucleoside triphosphate hydrolase protein [Armillaria novae-zelandiae]
MSHKRLYRSDLFSPEQLTSRDALESALEELQSILTKVNFKHVFQELIDNESPHFLPLVLSSLSETTSLISWMLESFPSDAANYDASVHCKIISCLSTELISSSFVEDKELCARHHERTQIVPMALKYLAGVSFLRPIDNRLAHHSKKGKAKQSQKKLQQVKREDGVTMLVKKYFDILNVDVPKTSSHASALVDHLLKSQKDTLEFCSELIRHPEISASLEERCITSAPLIEEEKNASGAVIELPSAYPMVQPMKSALYFDTAEGFGDWIVIISTNADIFLRSTHKKDLSTFNLAVKKIKELSCGQFTDNNQKRLSGSMTEVPVFEAKVSRNLRLIYQIDIIPGDDNEQQAIKIFGIYNNDQIDNRLWSSISSQLRKKGKEYRKRCAVRKRAEQASRDTFIPVFFPPLPEVSPSEIESIPDLRPDETAQIHSRLVVEKYVTFSQPFLKTILADVDATFPHMVSSQEKRIIECPKSCYVIGRSGTGKTTTMLFKMLLIERTFQLMGSDLPRPRQVFVTKSRVLAKKVQEYFEKLTSSLAIASRPSADLTNQSGAQYRDDSGLIDADDVTDWRTDLPAKYSELEERHFPLFITFDNLCDLLEADMDSIGIKRDKSRMGIITFESFCESYWSHFPEPKRRQSTFADQRCEVYKLFELYMRQKKLRGEYDTGDRTHNILKHFAERGTPGQGLDHLYVDEVQDNMLIDTLVLRALCNNAEGLFWAGDTAQTISVGSSFRFNALKAFQWNIEDQYRKKHGAGAGCNQPPEVFQLAVNYRSHAGIVDCAHSVIDLITTFWEDSIDRLSPEMGIVDGFKPVFFNTEDRTQLEQFIFGNIGDHIEFGAQQCIIVRNETARERLQQQVGEVGLVLTVYESKGLEFNDVGLYVMLQYNFLTVVTPIDASFRFSFITSLLIRPAEYAQWRVVLNAIEESRQDSKELVLLDLTTSVMPAFVMRARENIWIADGSETGEPMRTFWTSKDLINNYTPGSDAPRLASSSTPEEWASKGRELFHRKQFSHAKHCYVRANLPILASIAGAY